MASSPWLGCDLEFGTPETFLKRPLARPLQPRGDPPAIHGKFGEPVGGGRSKALRTRLDYPSRVRVPHPFRPLILLTDQPSQRLTPRRSVPPRRGLDLLFRGLSFLAGSSCRIGFGR